MIFVVSAGHDSCCLATTSINERSQECALPFSGSAARQAAAAAADAGDSLAGDARGQLEQASLGVARELRGELQRGQSDTLRALSTIQPRLQVQSDLVIRTLVITTPGL